MRQLSGSDHIWFALETPDKPMHMMMFNIYEPETQGGRKTDLNFLKRHINQRIHSLPLREKLVKVPFKVDYPYWVEDERFRLENHVFQHKLAGPATWQGLLETAKQLSETPLDFSIPPWEIHLITGLGRISGFAVGSYAVAIKLHHAQFDGTNVMRLLSTLHSDPAPIDDTHLREQKPAAPSRLTLLARSAWNNSTYPWRSAWTVGKNIPSIVKSFRVKGNGEKTKKGKSPTTRFSGVIKNFDPCFDVVEMPLEEVKTMRTKVKGATINDVALTIAGGALRLYLLAKNELTQEPLRIFCPVSAHAKNEKKNTTNKNTIMQVTLHTEIEDPLERLAVTHQETQRSKDRIKQMGASNVTEIVDIFPTNVLSYFVDVVAQSPFADKFSIATLLGGGSGVALTNVPGTREPHYLGKDKMVKSFSTLPFLDGNGLMLAVSSYIDTLQIQFFSNRGMIPDPDFFKSCIQESLAEMRCA